MAQQILLADHTHLAQINAIYNHYVLHSTCTYQTEPATEGERRAWFEERSAQHPVTVLIDAAAPDVVLGWASLNMFHKRAAYRFTAENSVYVDARHHRRGLGRLLLSDLLERAVLLKYRSMIALISADQAASIALHAALGFTECGRLQRVGFKFDRWLDVVYMQRHLVSATP